LEGRLEVVEQVLGGLEACIGHEQRIFELFAQRLVDLGAREYRGNVGAGLAQPGLEPAQPGTFPWPPWPRP